MVVFTCNHCGETLHKPKVEKHYQFQCRNYKSVTCVDCFKDFKNEEYVVHTKCITEDERYAAKGTYKNGIVKKGEVKQESWLEMIKSICETETNLKPSCRKLLETISEYSNVPRKKQKFLNFIRSSSGNRAVMKDVEEVWDIIEKYKTSNSQNNMKTGGKGNDKVELKTENSEKRPLEESECLSVKKKKQKTSETVAPEATDIKEDENAAQTVKFDFKANILQILSEKDTISLKKLQKKVLKAYISTIGQYDSEDKILKKFNKKLKKIPSINITENRVSLES
ncbi:uncharacterized protein C16C10.8 [Anthonomus grandis grandis]|uniref:uncharacterized protein C16C10.8 n=1 Tax=Anthonomus grandis grandis TaxID=2921223 RepID=UPI00216547B1|nr:uncharacterized protein C16C10.8 [Anthonomus grandis grandis]